ncbi:MAG TPA: neutral zinc metallopeptidase [Verrucomicrobiae bacterium]|nr:neutral zinc metallopeptidase [Verrucomicrobiae bacterium]
MRWRMGRQSQNVEDLRGSGGGFGGGMGGGMPRMPMGSGRRAGGIGGLGLIVIVVLALLFGFDPSQLLQGNLGAPTYQPGDESMIQNGSDDELKQFSAAVLASTEDVWSGIFQQSGKDYHEPTLVLFSGGVQSACGFAQAAVGPFYCPGDSKLYVDLDFLQQLTRQLNAPGDFAQAYVIAHEVGHHVQNEIGVMKETQAMHDQMSEVEWNAVSVKIELQADCFAGVWANHVNSDTQMIEPGDIEEAINAAGAVGDDSIQQQSQGYVRPETFTHGSSQQRTEWFNKGFKSGEPKACDTFN